MKKIMKKITKKNRNEKKKSPRPVWPTYGVRWAGGPPVLASSTAQADDIFQLKQKFIY
jgi:hypothetical protein